MSEPALLDGSRLRVYIQPRDWWVGVYIGSGAVYVCLLPCVVFRWRRKRPPLVNVYVGMTVPAEIAGSDDA